MIALQPSGVEAYSSILIKITPSQIVSYLFIIIVTIAIVVFVGRTFYTTHRRNKHIKDAKGMILCEFTPATGGGQVYRVLCREEKGEIRKVDLKEHGKFETDSFVRSPKQLPNEVDIEQYLLLPEHDYLDVYPFGVSPAQQVPIRKYYFNEGEPYSQMPHDSKKWNTERYSRVTAQMFHASQDTVALKGILGEVSGMMQHFYDALDNLKKMRLVIIGLVVVVFFNMITLFISFNGMRMTEKIIKFIAGT